MTLTLSYTNEIILQDAIESANKVIQDSYCANTKRALEGDITYIKAWYSANGLEFENVTKQHIILYVIQHAEEMPPHIDAFLCGNKVKAKEGTHSISTIERRLASLSHYLNVRNLPNPCRDKDVNFLLRKLTEKNGSSESWGKAITLDVLNDLLSTCDESVVGVRDRALLLFGFSTGGRRRSEISSADMKNLMRNSDGNYIYNLKKSKTNQAGKDDFKPIAGRAAIALMIWLEHSKIVEGPIFRGIYKTGKKISEKALCDAQISRIVKGRCLKAGYDPVLYTAHSLRSGFVTESGKRGKPVGDVMAMTGHRNVGQLMKYYQSGSVLNNSAAYLAG